MKNTIVISAFPASGKSYSETYMNSDGYKVVDMDNGEFDFSKPETMEYLKENIGKVDYIFVSTAKEVRNALKEAGIRYLLIYPRAEYKEEWVGRRFLRHMNSEDKSPVVALANNWANWVNDCREDTGAYKKYVLLSGEYVERIIDMIERARAFELLKASI